METVKIKTCSELQSFAWLDGALVRLEDLGDVQREEMAEHSDKWKIWLTGFPENLPRPRYLSEQWIAYKWMYQHSPSPPYRGPSLQE